jgi:hypothetical protein
MRYDSGSVIDDVWVDDSVKHISLARSHALRGQRATRDMQTTTTSTVRQLVLFLAQTTRALLLAV